MGRTRRLSPSSRTCAISSAKVILVPDISPPATPTVHRFLRALRTSSLPPSSSELGMTCDQARVGAPKPNTPRPIIPMTIKMAKHNAPRTARITPPSGTRHYVDTVTPAFAYIVLGFGLFVRSVRADRLASSFALDAALACLPFRNVRRAHSSRLRRWLSACGSPPRLIGSQNPLGRRDVGLVEQRRTSKILGGAHPRLSCGTSCGSTTSIICSPLQTHARHSIIDSRHFAFANTNSAPRPLRRLKHAAQRVLLKDHRQTPWQ
jgi:hypothetical protein